MPEKFNDIADGLVKVADNKGRWQRIMGSVVIVSVLIVGGFVVYNKTKPVKKEVVKEDCAYYIEQNRQLLGALLHVKQIENAMPTSYNETKEDYFIFTSYLMIDTTPRQRMINRYIDSVLHAIKKQDSIRKIDSIKKSKSKV